MGVCCESNLSHFKEDVLADLKAPSTRHLNDKFAVWEYGTPFMRTPFLAFKNAVNLASLPADQGYVTIESLAATLTTEAWSDLKDSDSQLCQMLNSDTFRYRASEESKMTKMGEIDKKTLIMFGVLHCRDRKIPTQKARGLYELLKGGTGAFERQDFIAA